MTNARQDATIRKIERDVRKHLPKLFENATTLSGYDDEMGENIGDLESDEGENLGE
jgi:hypothetical protein